MPQTLNRGVNQEAPCRPRGAARLRHSLLSFSLFSRQARVITGPRGTSPLRLSLFVSLATISQLEPSMFRWLLSRLRPRGNPWLVSVNGETVKATYTCPEQSAEGPVTTTTHGFTPPPRRTAARKWFRR
jgi:hypothetical protein